MEKYNLAVVGATGAVGSEMIKILEERDFPVADLKLIASNRSKGKKISFKDHNITIETIDKNTFNDIDIALFSIDSSLSKKIAPQAVKAGAVVIDNSNAFRMDEDIPLVIPEINPAMIEKNNGIIANPNCSTIQLVMACQPIYREYGIKRMVVSTYQAVSGTGRKAVKELEDQIRGYIKHEEIENEVYLYQIAFNLLPHIDDFKEDGYTREEKKVLRETRKILDDPDIPITTTAVRVPVFNGHGESVNIETEVDFDLAQIRELISKADNVRVVDNPETNTYPMPIMVEEDDDILVGRIRRDFSQDKTLNMWIVGNNLRKGAALNAVQIAEKLV